VPIGETRSPRSPAVFSRLTVQEPVMWIVRFALNRLLVAFFSTLLPWFVLVQKRNPELLNFFFIVQLFRNYLTPEQNLPGPFYYFAPVLIVGLLPWLSVALIGSVPGQSQSAGQMTALSDYWVGRGKMAQ
jgi:4-amino-4-deoxy-L-arabinose transferase-like glycosyltransferase